MTNRRGSKRLISVEVCYKLLATVWNSLQSEFLYDCYMSSYAQGSATTLMEEVEREAENRLSAALDKYYTDFAFPNKEMIKKEAFFCLEAVPYIGGISSIREATRDHDFFVLFFKRDEYPISSLFPSFHSVLNQSLVLPSQEILLMSPSFHPIPIHSCPSSQEIEAFCKCLDSIVNSTPSFSDSDRTYFELLKERIRIHYLHHFSVC